MIVAGIDPGAKGAACAFDCTRRLPVDVIDLPIREDGTKNQLDVLELCRWLHKFEISWAVVERTVPMPGLDPKTGMRSRGIGSVSAFRSGMMYGQLRGCIEANGIPLTLVTPKVWKGHFSLTGPDKEQDRQLALARFPSMRDRLTRKMDDGRADAILIACWAGRHIHGLKAGTV